MTCSQCEALRLRCYHTAWHAQAQRELEAEQAELRGELKWRLNRHAEQIEKLERSRMSPETASGAGVTGAVSEAISAIESRINEIATTVSALSEQDIPSRLGQLHDQQAKHGAIHADSRAQLDALRAEMQSHSERLTLLSTVSSSQLESVDAAIMRVSEQLEQLPWRQAAAPHSSDEVMLNPLTARVDALEHAVSSHRVTGASGGCDDETSKVVRRLDAHKERLEKLTKAANECRRAVRHSERQCEVMGARQLELQRNVDLCTIRVEEEISSMAQLHAYFVTEKSLALTPDGKAADKSPRDRRLAARIQESSSASLAPALKALSEQILLMQQQMDKHRRDTQVALADCTAGLTALGDDIASMRSLNDVRGSPAYGGWELDESARPLDSRRVSSLMEDRLGRMQQQLSDSIAQAVAHAQLETNALVSAREAELRLAIQHALSSADPAVPNTSAVGGFGSGEAEQHLARLEKRVSDFKQLGKVIVESHKSMQAQLDSSMKAFSSFCRWTEQTVLGLGTKHEQLLGRSVGRLLCPTVCFGSHWRSWRTLNRPCDALPQ